MSKQKPEYELIDSHKLNYHPEWVKRWHGAQGNWDAAKTIYPLYIEISPAGQCNHRCSWCAVDYIGYKNRLLDVENLKNIFMQMSARRLGGEEWNGVKSVMFAGEGEPTLHPQLSGMISSAKHFGIDTALTTNGTGMTRKFIDRSLDKLIWIKVSLDAATAGTHFVNHHASKEDFALASSSLKFRDAVANKGLKEVKNEFDRIIENIRYACELNKGLDRKCMIGAQLLMNPTNIYEVLDFAQLMKEIGCDYCVIKPYSQHHYSLNRQDLLFGEFSYSDCMSLGEKAKKLSDKSFNVVFRGRAMENYEDPDRHYTICQSTPMAWGYIMATGEFVSCSAYLPQDVGVGDQRFVLGNISTQTFQEIWEGEKRQHNWEFVNNELNIMECRKNCRMDAVNRFLWDIKDSDAATLSRELPVVVDKPRNINFI